MEMKIRVQFSESQFLSANGWGASREPIQGQNLQSSPCANCFLCTLSKLEPSLVLWWWDLCQIPIQLWPTDRSEQVPCWLNAHVSCALSILNKGWCGMSQAVPRAPLTKDNTLQYAAMLPPEWTFNFSNYQSNAFCHSRRFISAFVA